MPRSESENYKLEGVGRRFKEGLGYPILNRLDRVTKDKIKSFPTGVKKWPLVKWQLVISDWAVDSKF